MRIVIGTAGHVDHGKTALVKALTGIDTDRLAEEKRRGITIELGFAHLPLEGGTVAGVVDVPGHERFVRAMVAGAGGVDLVILVVAADEGVMPQTREHLDVCQLLCPSRGIVVITKSDLLPGLGSEWLELVEEEVRNLTRGTFLEDAPILPVSAFTGEGLGELLKALGRLAGEVRERPADGPFFLPLDRAFSLKGFGTVVTGTLLSGSVGEGDSVALLPSPSTERLRVRSLQVHGKVVSRAFAGQRTAVNLPGVEAGAIRRGQALAHPGVVPPSSILDVDLTLLPVVPRPLRNRSRLLLHIGTAQVGASVILFDRAQLVPGETSPAQLRLETSVAAIPGQRFILRGFAALAERGRTAAGGRVLAVAAPRRRHGRREAAEKLAALLATDPDARVSAVLEMAGPAGLEIGAAVGRTALSPKALQLSLERLGARREALLFDRDHQTWVSGAVAHALSGRMVDAIEAHHRDHPLSAGIGREELRRRLPQTVDVRLFQRLVALAAQRGEIALEEDHVRLSGHAAPSGGAQQDRLAALLAGAGLSPPSLAELPGRTGGSAGDVAALLKLLVAEGRVVRVSAEFYFDAAALAELQARLVTYLREHDGITTQEFKNLVGATRKHVIPLAEHFDRTKVTLRVGERRVLRGAPGA